MTVSTFNTTILFYVFAKLAASAQYETDEKERTLIDEHDAALLLDKNVLKSLTKHKNVVKTRHKLKAHTSKIVSSFKTPSLTR